MLKTSITKAPAFKTIALAAAVLLAGSAFAEACSPVPAP